jgi:phytoene synthase
MSCHGAAALVEPVEPFEPVEPLEPLRDTSFYYSFLVLPARKRDAIIAVWDVCRALDDTVDEPGSRPPAEALAEWRTELARAFDGTPLTPQGQRLQPVIREFSLSRRPFDDLIDGIEMDLTTTRYPTFEALYEYCWRVASTVGLICIEIFECRHPRSRDYAIALGVALQLTNILRDVAADLERDRIYLPQEDLARFSCSEQDLRATTVGERLRAVLAHEAGRAREYYARARVLLPREDLRALLPAEIMGGIYGDLLRRIERARFDVLGTRVRVPRPRRAAIAASIWARSLLGLRAA